MDKISFQEVLRTIPFLPNHSSFGVCYRCMLDHHFNMLMLEIEARTKLECFFS
jgi:hypothetical protein